MITKIEQNRTTDLKVQSMAQIMVTKAATAMLRSMGGI